MTKKEKINEINEKVDKSNNKENPLAEPKNKNDASLTQRPSSVIVNSLPGSLTNNSNNKECN